MGSIIIHHKPCLRLLVMQLRHYGTAAPNQPPTTWASLMKDIKPDARKTSGCSLHCSWQDGLQSIIGNIAKDVRCLPLTPPPLWSLGVCGDHASAGTGWVRQGRSVHPRPCRRHSSPLQTWPGRRYSPALQTRPSWGQGPALQAWSCRCVLTASNEGYPKFREDFTITEKALLGPSPG